MANNSRTPESIYKLAPMPKFMSLSEFDDSLMDLEADIFNALDGTLLPNAQANNSLFSILHQAEMMAANISSNHTRLTDTNEYFRQTLHYIDLYLLPVMLGVGLMGNLLCAAVFLGTYLRRLSSSIYLGALAVADTGFLLCVLVSWGMNTGFNLYHREGWCQTFIYLTYVSSFLSVWYVVSFTVERYMVVHVPLRRQELCTAKRAKLVVFGLAGFAALVYSFAPWMSGVIVLFGEPICGFPAHYDRVVSVFNNVDTLITLIIPFLVILVMNLKIAHKVSQFYREAVNLEVRYSCKDRLVVRKPSHQEALLRVCMVRRHGSDKKKTPYTRTQIRITKLLLIISTTFLALNLPRHTLRTYLFIKSLSDEHYIPSRNYILWQKLFQLLYYLNFSVNLFLYSVLGKNFRKALNRLFRKFKYSVMNTLRKTSQAQNNLILAENKNDVLALAALNPEKGRTSRSSALYV